jgi:ABC-type transport system involved in multi-copper enzyme maturation permease subunit
MNRSIAKALALDAYYQVLDNRVFRLLLVLAGILILPTLLIGAREEGLVILFGVKTIPWSAFLEAFGNVRMDVPADFHKSFIAGFQDMIVQNLAGSAGVLFSIAATAFFVPRMLEKGSADVVFSRPIGRTTLLLTRWLSGVIFVALLSTALVLGLHLSLLLVSGHSDPAFLWNIPSLVYVFALVHAVSTLTAVLTRSSVAAILVALMFFLFNGCIHRGWITLQHRDAIQQQQQAEAKASEESPTEDSESGLLQALKTALHVAHHALPKTTDADLIVGNLRESISGKATLIQDTASGAYWKEQPEDLSLTGARGLRDLSVEPAIWEWKRGDQQIGTLSIRRESRLMDSANGKIRKRSSRVVAKEFLATLPTEAQPKLEGLSYGAFGGDMVVWSEDGQRRLRSWTSVGDSFLIGEASVAGDALPPEQVQRNYGFLFARMEFDRDDPRALSEADWYRKRLSWTAGWPYNTVWSLTSSVVFAALLLAIAAWRLSRIDF